MSKPAAIVLLIVLILLLYGIFRILLPSIRIYIARMPKGIFVLLFLAIIGTIGYLTYYLINPDRTGGTPGNEAKTESEAETEPEAEQNKDAVKILKDNCIVLNGSDIIIENEKTDIKAVESYLDYRVENNIEVTIVDIYSSSALMSEIRAVCEKKGVRYSIEDETWIE